MAFLLLLWTVLAGSSENKVGRESRLLDNRIALLLSPHYRLGLTGYFKPEPFMKSRSHFQKIVAFDNKILLHDIGTHLFFLVLWLRVRS